MKLFLLPVYFFACIDAFRAGNFGRCTTHLSSSINISDDVMRSVSEVPSTSAPLSQNTFAGKVEQALLQKFKPSKIERVISSWRLAELGYEHREFVGDQQSPAITDAATSRCYQHAPSYLPGLKAKAWWDDAGDELAWARSLSKSFESIRDEFTSIMSAPDKLSEGNNVWAGALSTDAESYGEGWKTLVLLNRGQWDENNAKLFPVTSKAIHQSGAPVAEAFFASMKPQTSIKPHSDFTNFVLTSHLPLVIPENGNNKCRLSVGDETREWLEGQVILFDTSIYHDAINESQEMRYILMLRIWHPDLTEVEIDALQFIYDCLEFPQLLSGDSESVYIAEQRAKMVKEFPLTGRSKTGGFGGGSKTKGKAKRKKGRK